MGEDSHYNAFNNNHHYHHQCWFFVHDIVNCIYRIIVFSFEKQFIKHSDKLKGIEHVYIRATLLLNCIKLSFQYILLKSRHFL